MSVNIYDLAREANVSIATASKALNGRRDVNEETRKRVLEVAKRINYHPSHLARGLASRRTENIGIVSWRRFPQASLMVNPFYSRVLEGIEAEVTARNYNLLISVVPDPDPAKAQAPKMVRERGIDGLILLGEMAPSVTQAVFERRMPTVIVDSFNPQIAAHYVLTDNYGGAVAMVEHLASLGHKRLAFAGALKDWSFQERLRGFRDACARLGLQAGDLDVQEPWGEAWDQALIRQLKRPERPGAIVVCNDGLACYILELARKAGLDAPRDFSITGFDDIDKAGAMGLTTVRVDKQAMGRRAIQRIFKLMEPPLELSSREDLPVELVVRSSTGPPARP